MPGCEVSPPEGCVGGEARLGLAGAKGSLSIIARTCGGQIACINALHQYT